MMLVAEAVNRRFDSRVQEFDNKHEQANTDQQGPFNNALAEPDSDGRQ